MFLTICNVADSNDVSIREVARLYLNKIQSDLFNYQILF